MKNEVHTSATLRDIILYLEQPQADKDENIHLSFSKVEILCWQDCRFMFSEKYSFLLRPPLASIHLNKPSLTATRKDA